MTIPDWKLERLALGELPPAELARLNALVAADPRLQDRLAALRAGDAELLRTYPPEVVVPALRRHLQPRRLHLWLAPALVAAALVLVVVRQGGDVDQTPPSVLEVTRAKGLVPHLLVHRQRGDVSEILAEGASARAGDLLQLTYVPAGRAHGVLVSLDGRGAVTLHFPALATAPTTLERTAEVALPNAYELDDAPKHERFFLVTSERPIDVQRVLAAAATLARSPDAAQAPLPLEATLEQISVTLRKVP